MNKSPIVHSPVQHEHGRVLLQADAQQQLLDGGRAAATARQPSAQFGLRHAAAATLAVLRQHLHVDELEVAGPAGAAAAPDARGVHRHHLDDVALLQVIGVIVSAIHAKVVWLVT